MKPQEEIIRLQKKINKLNLEIEYLRKRVKKSKCYDKVRVNEALKRDYKVVATSKKRKFGYRINVPVCFANKIVKLKIIK